MRVVDVMTEAPLTVTPSVTVGHVEELMAEHDIRQLPVVQGKELVGVVTDRDVRSILSGPLVLDPDGREKALKTLVGDIMTADPISISPSDGLQKALTVLIEEKVGGVPVVDAGAGLVGIVTYVDLLRCFLNRIQEE
jgi:CBS domain-containing protein